MQLTISFEGTDMSNGGSRSSLRIALGHLFYTEYANEITSSLAERVKGKGKSQYFTYVCIANRLSGYVIITTLVTNIISDYYYVWN